MRFALRRLPVLIFSVCLCAIAARANSSNITFGPASGSFSVTGTAGTGGGLDLSGGVGGTDSNGSAYCLGFDGACSPLAGTGTFFASCAASFLTGCQWTESPLCNTSSCGLGFSDCSFGANSLGICGPGTGGIDLQQTSSSQITMSIVIGVGQTIVLDLQVDPVMLSSLQPGQSANLIVTGGCVTTGASSCPTSTAPTPEPGTLLLLGSGLTGIGFIRRKFSSV